MAHQQVLIIGLGQFGTALGRALAEHGDDVIAVDYDEERTQLASSYGAEAITIDATDEQELALLRPDERDLCVCAIGDDSREASILVTAMLRQLGAKRIVARSTDDLHERILRLVGAHEGINPERMLGERLAARLSSRGLLEVVPLGDDLTLCEMAVPAAMRGRRLSELSLPDRHGLVVAAVRRDEGGTGKVVLPRAETRLLDGDVLVLIGRDGAANELLEAL